MSDDVDRPADARIRVGIGGWTFEPWRGSFYPKGLARSEELAFASRAVTTIEINATYYRLQTAKSFAHWHESTPDDFVFCVKGSRYVTNRRKLAEAGEAIERFMASGLAELQGKLGPLVWQLPTTKVFERIDVEAFLRLLPSSLAGRPVRHALEVRHPSFMCEDYLAAARHYGVTTVFADSSSYPSFDDTTGSFTYARLMQTESRYKAGYSPKRVEFWAESARLWSHGLKPPGLHNVDAVGQQAGARRDVFVFFISGAKERAPAAALALIEQLGARL